MNKTQKNVYSDGKGNFLDRLRAMSLYARIFAVIALVFFVLGVSTLGSLNGTGKKVSLPVSSAAVTFAYRLDYESGETLSDIYVNVGTIYAEPGGDEAKETLYVQGYYYHEDDGDKHSIASMRLANIYTNFKTTSTSTPTYRSNANYNWVVLTSGKSYTYSTILLNFTPRVAADINEVAFVNADGKVISASVVPSLCSGVSADEVKNTLDRQGSFHKRTSARYNFTQEEEYILETIEGLQLKIDSSESEGSGVSAMDGYTYIMTADYNSFGVLIYALFTGIFGKSTFGLRLPSFLATFGTFILLYFFAKKLFKSEKWGALFACLFGIGGTFFTVGRVGTPTALIVLAVVASAYFMYWFYSKGLDRQRPLRSALPILWSGLCAGAGIAVSSVAIYPCTLSLVIFIAGIVRLCKSCNYKIAKAEGAFAKRQTALAEGAENAEPVVEVTTTEETAAAAASDLEKTVYEIKEERNYGLRVSIGFFLVSFAAFTAILLAVCALITYPVYARYYVAGGEQANFMALFLEGFKQCFTVGDYTLYSEGNHITPWSWFLSLRGATLWSTTATANDVTTVAQWNAQGNTVLCIVAAAGLCFSACYTAVGAVLARRGDKNFRHNKRYKAAARAFVGLLAGCILSLLPYLFAGEWVSAVQSHTFQLFYLGFIVLFFYILEGFEGAGKKKIGKTGVALLVILAIAVLYFVFTTPMCFGWNISDTAAKILYNWTGILSNGQYGLISFGD